MKRKFRIAYFFQGFLGDKKSSGHHFLMAESKAAKHLKTNIITILLVIIIKSKDTTSCSKQYSNLMPGVLSL